MKKRAEKKKLTLERVAMYDRKKEYRSLQKLKDCNKIMLKIYWSMIFDINAILSLISEAK